MDTASYLQTLAVSSLFKYETRCKKITKDNSCSCRPEYLIRFISRGFKLHFRVNTSNSVAPAQAKTNH